MSKFAKPLVILAGVLGGAMMMGIMYDMMLSMRAMRGAMLEMNQSILTMRGSMTAMSGDIDLVFIIQTFRGNKTHKNLSIAV